MIIFIELYLILEFFLGINRLIELCFGNDKLWIIWNFLGFDLGIIFNGEDIKLFKGGDVKGFVILFSLMFWWINFWIIEGCFNVFLWLWEILELGKV